MTIIPVEQYLESIGTDGQSFGPYVRSLVNRDPVVCGFFHWDPDSSWRWAGPWPTHMVFARITDETNGYPGRPLKTRAEEETHNADYIRHSSYYFPHRLWGDQIRQLASSERQKWYKGLSRKEKSRYDIAIKESIANRSAETMGFPHVENPIRVYLAGNDDCSYSRVFPTVDAAKEALQQIIEIPMWETLESFGFVFTN